MFLFRLCIILAALILFGCSEQERMRTEIANLESITENDPADAFKLRRAYAIYVRKFPDDAVYLAKAGDTFLKQQRFEQAINCFTNLIHLQPNHAASFRKRGSAHKHLRQFDQAIKDYDYALVGNNTDKALIEQLHRVKEQADIYEDIKMIDDKIQAAPSNFLYYLARGKLFFLMKEYRAAIWDLSNVLHMEGFLPEPLYLRAASYFAVFEFNNALTDADFLIKRKVGFGRIDNRHFLALRQIIEETRAFNKKGGKVKMPEFTKEFLDYN